MTVCPVGILAKPKEAKDIAAGPMEAVDHRVTLRCQCDGESKRSCGGSTGMTEAVEIHAGPFEAGGVRSGTFGDVQGHGGGGVAKQN